MYSSQASVGTVPGTAGRPLLQAGQQVPATSGLSFDFNLTFGLLAHQSWRYGVTTWCHSWCTLYRYRTTPLRGGGKPGSPRHNNIPKQDCRSAWRNSARSCSMWLDSSTKSVYGGGHCQHLVSDHDARSPCQVIHGAHLSDPSPGTLDSRLGLRRASGCAKRENTVCHGDKLLTAMYWRK